ncbi:MAG: hypothetical protein NT154_26210 [Verrucomicrobia bacterium]|nr:hypothetical protein [Verrucomicrobiota bacterium]
MNSPCGATYTYTGASTNPPSWGNLTNWFPQGVPAASDTIIIPGFPGGPVDAPNWTFTDLRLHGGSIRGTFTIGGTLDWTGGTFSGLITVSSNVVVNLAFVQAGVVNGRLINHGRIVWPAGTFSALVFDNGILENAADGSVDVQLDVDLLTGGVGNGQIINTGVIRKSGGGGISQLRAGVSMQNTGLLDLQSGRLDFYDGFTSSGTFNVTNGAALNLSSGTFHLLPGHQFTGGGDYGVLRWNAIIDGPITDPNFQLLYGILTISNQITGTLLWGGYATLAGAPTIASNGVLKNINAPCPTCFPVTLSGVLTNYGLFLWPTGTYPNIVFDNARQENMPGALVDVQMDGGLSLGPGGPGVFNNAGTLRKSVGNGGGVAMAFQKGFVFNNTGLVEVQSGAFQFTDGFTSSAPFSLATNTAVELSGGTFHFLPGHAFSGPGTYRVDGPVVIDGPITEPNWQLTGGVLTISNQISGMLAWSDGTLAGAPTVASTGVLSYLRPGAAGSPLTLSGVLTNHGVFRWPTGSYPTIVLSSGRLENMPDGLVDMQVDGGFYSEGSSAQVNNAGVLRKSVGGGTGIFANGVGFQNTGLLDIQSGTMQLPGNSLLAGGRLNSGLASRSEWGRVAFSGAGVLNGSLSASPIGGFIAGVGEHYQVVSSGGLNGGFTSLSLPNHFFVTNTASSIFLVVGSGGPATLTSPARTGTNLIFSFQTEAGGSYTLQANADLGTTNWSFVQAIPGDGSLKSIVTPCTGIPQHFFRLVQP